MQHAAWAGILTSVSNEAPTPAAPVPVPDAEAPPMDQAAFERILHFGVERGISDLHFEVGHPPHLRLQGDLLPAKYPAQWLSRRFRPTMLCG